jgi:hypothetical protein
MRCDDEYRRVSVTPAGLRPQDGLDAAARRAWLSGLPARVDESKFVCKIQRLPLQPHVLQTNFLSLHKKVNLSIKSIGR